MAWVIDPAHTLIEFSAKHMMITTVRGRFGEFSGILEIDEEHPDRSYVEGSVDMASIDTRDERRDGHLRSADFFDVGKYPAMTFRSTHIEAAGRPGRYAVVGDLTIKDTTREVTFDVTDEGKAKDPWGGQRWGLAARTVLNRKDFGLNWNVALEAGGWLVGDEIKAAIELQLVHQPAEAEREAVAATAVA